MYGIIGSASGQSGPPRGRMQRVIMPAEQAGQSAAPWRCVDQVGPVADRPVVAHRADGGKLVPVRGLDRRQAGQHVLAVHEVDALLGDDLRQRVSAARDTAARS